jgi:hypothetical protein
VRKALFAAALSVLMALVYSGVVMGADSAPVKPAPEVKAAPATPTAPAAPAVKPADPKVPVLQAPPPRPATRTIPRKVGEMIYMLKMKPGVPEPGDMVELTIDVVQAVQTPHPVYGDRIPVGGAKILAKVAHEKAPDAALKYQVQPFGDEGTYGFHFTPEQLGKYLVTFSVLISGRDKDDVKFSVPIGVWPLPADADMGDSLDDGQGKRGVKRQAGPVVPVGPVSSNMVKKVDKGEALRSLMKRVEKLWMYVGKDLGGDRKPDMVAIARESEAVATVAAKGVGMVPEQMAAGGVEFDSIMKALADAAKEVSSAAKAGDQMRVTELYRRAGYNSCTRCHLKFRFHSTEDLGRFPPVQGGK